VWDETGGSVGDKDTLVPGDYIYMKNKDDYDRHAPSPPGGVYVGENCIYYGLDSSGAAKFGGLGLSDLTESDLRAALKFAYETDCAPHTVANPDTEIRFTIIGRIKTGE
jgi:hypothetical protein